MRPPLGAALAVLALAAPARADDVDDLLKTIAAVKPDGDAAKARAAWDKLVAKGPKVLPRVLAAMDTPDTAVANWLRTAFDAVAEPELKAGGKRLDADALLAFAKDAKRQGRARRLALETVEKLRPGTTRRLLADGLDDPEFRYDAVEQLLKDTAAAKGLAKDKTVAAYTKAFTASRDLGQARDAAARLKELGVSVSVADHLGFLRDWYVVGPFDANKGKGFKAVYPPERKVDLTADYEGKDKKELRWVRYAAPETPVGRFPVQVDLRKPLGAAEDAVAYAYTAFKVDKAATVEFRGAGDDNLTAWVNGERVFGFEEYRNGIRLDRHVFRVKLKAGVNTVLLKVCQAPHDPDSPDPNWEFLLRVTDLGGAGRTFPSALPPAPKAKP